MRYEHLLFRRGYLLTDGDLAAADSQCVNYVRAMWERTSACRFTIYRDPDLPLHLRQDRGLLVMLLGTVLDPVNAIADAEAIVRDLHACLSKSDEAFFDRLDDLSGRFVVLVETGSRAFALQDATGTRTLFYDTGSDGLTISSHASLIAEVAGYEMSDMSRELLNSRDYTTHLSRFPGLYTPYPAVRTLTPNTLLDLADLRVRRFYPRGPLDKTGLTDRLVEEFSLLMRSQVSMLAERSPLSVSLTAGIDSRVTMAATAGWGDRVDYFTYVQQPEQELEASIASESCDVLGARHTTYHIDERSWGEGLDEYMRVWRLNTAGMRADVRGHICKVLYENHPRDRLHIESIVSEVGKALFRSGARGFLPNEITPEVLARRYAICPSSVFVLEAFRKYIDTVGFTKDAIFNYDLYDLFYWEFICGVWGGLHTLDLDMAMDTFILYNNRRVLETMLSIPLLDRLKRNLHKRSAAFMWPEGAGVPLLPDLKPWHVKATKEVARSAKYRIESVLDALR